MAVDTVQKRMSAMNPACPWRGPLVDATESGFSKGNRQAADYAYSGLGDHVLIKFISESVVNSQFKSESAVYSSVQSESLVQSGMINETTLGEI